MKENGSRLLDEEYVKDAIDVSSEDEVIGLYDKELHEEKLRLSEIAEAKQAGIKEGKADGINIGKKDGIKEGAYQKALETAKNMLKKNIDIETISECIGLTKEEIEAIK